jgi:phage-related protein
MRRFKGKVEKFKQSLQSDKKTIPEAVLTAASGADNALDKLTDTLDVFGPVIEKIKVFADITAKIGEVKSLQLNVQGLD